MKKTTYERYQRQILLKEFGESGQRKLLRSKVLVIGAGGLGCPVLQYLAAAGIGTLGVVDDDFVSFDNLHRQVLYRNKDIGKPKAKCAANSIRLLNPEITIRALNIQLTNQNALEILAPYDVVIDGTDNLPSRYMINDACTLLNKPLVYGAISRFEGQLAVFNYPDKLNVSTNYRDLFPDPPSKNETFNCEENGVLGILPGIIGSLQANEAIKIITGMGTPLVNRLLTYNALSNQMYQVEIVPGKENRSLVPVNENLFRKMDYTWLCSTELNLHDEINISEFVELLNENDVTVLDIREHGEINRIKTSQYHRIPFSQLKNKSKMIQGDKVVVVCQAGIGSKLAVKQLSEIFGSQKKIFSLQGGILQWNKYLESQTYERKNT